MIEAFLPQDAQERWNDPRMQAAMLQLGISLMQPTGVGQSVGGHVGSAIGQAAAAAGRQESSELKRQQEDLKTAATIERMENASERLKLAGENAALRRQSGAVKSMNEILAERRRARQGVGKAADEEAKAILKQLNDEALLPDNMKNPNLVRFRGMQQSEIAAALANDPEFRKRRAAVMGDEEPQQAAGAQSAIANARAAIARGANREAVIQRLRQYGIDPGGL
jgi:hypothetical protein